MLKICKFFNSLIILSILVFCQPNPIFGENLCLRPPLGNYARINYADYLAKGCVVDPITNTIILSGEAASAFLLQTQGFPHETTVCNLDTQPLTVELDSDTVTLDNIGVVAIKPGAKLKFKKIRGRVMVIITQKPDAINNWYKPYDDQNFATLFKEIGGYNKSGIISPEEWVNKGVTVIDFAGRKNQWTGGYDVCRE
jgi:hypothetical protein